jgi:head-tail adaptor
MGSRGFGAKGGGQLDELVRVQKPSQVVRAHTPETLWEDLVVPGVGLGIEMTQAQAIEASTIWASVVVLPEASQEVAAEIGIPAGVARTRVRVVVRHAEAIALSCRLLWRAKVINLTSVDHDTRRREGYSTLMGVIAEDAPVESVAGGGQVGHSKPPDGNTGPAPIPGEFIT